MSKARRNRDTRIWASLTGMPTFESVPFSPTAKATDEARYTKGPDPRLARGLSHGVSSRPAHVCVAKQFRFHPDAKLRALAEAQAKESHELNDIMAHGHICRGKCPAKACHRSTISTPLSMFQKNDHTMRIALGMKRAQRIKERGW